MLDLKKLIGDFNISSDCLKNGKETCLSFEGRQVIDDMDISHKKLCPSCAIKWHMRQIERAVAIL
jgi:hypothetical protein